MKAENEKLKIEVQRLAKHIELLTGRLDKRDRWIRMMEKAIAEYLPTTEKNTLDN